jgi:hypothetical protein
MLAIITDYIPSARRVLISNKAIAVVDLGLLRFQGQKNVHDFAKLAEVCSEFFF